jgi:FAD:protein FMN transferase
MRSRSSIEIRRCRPLLGTFVEIAAWGPNEKALSRGIETAFAAIAKVHRLMTFHNLTSDVSRMNRGAFPKGVTVHPWTWRVMNAARRFAQKSDGAFDVAVAAVLAKRNHFPYRAYHFDAAATFRNIFTRRNYEVFFNRPLIVDLGGIAKGFAVDRAVDALKRNGLTSGIVNAGGDIRVFGLTAQQVYLRNPRSPSCFSGMLRVRNRALATSASYFAPDALVDGKTRRSLAKSISVTVAARDCVTADALTKIVFALGEKAAPLLKRNRADAVLLKRDGTPSWIFHSPCDTRDRTRFA